MGSSGISATTIIATLGALIVIVASAVAGWVIVGNLEDEASRAETGINEEALSAVLAVNRQVNSLAEISSVESNLSMTRESVIETRNAIAEQKAELEKSLAVLEESGFEARVSSLREQVDQLITNVDAIESGRPDLLRAILAGEQNRHALSLESSRELAPAIISSLDNQRYYILTGRSEFRDTDAEPGDPLSREEFLRYSHLETLSRSAGVGHSSLVAASRMADPILVTSVEEAFDTARQRMEKSIEFLAENQWPELLPEVVPLSNRLLDAGAGEDNFFDDLRVRLAMAIQERELIEANKPILSKIESATHSFAEEIWQDSQAPVADTSQTASTGRMIMLIIGIVGVVGTLLMAGYLTLRGNRA